MTRSAVRWGDLIPRRRDKRVEVNTLHHKKARAVKRGLEERVWDELRLC